MTCAAPTWPVLHDLCCTHPSMGARPELHHPPVQESSVDRLLVGVVLGGILLKGLVGLALQVVLDRRRAGGGVGVGMEGGWWSGVHGVDGGGWGLGVGMERLSK